MGHAGVEPTHVPLTAAVGAQTYFFYGSTAISQLFHHVHVTGIPYGQKCAPCDTYDATHDATHTA